MLGSAMGIPVFSPKDPRDIDLFEFDLSALLVGGETVTAVTFSTQQIATTAVPSPVVTSTAVADNSPLVVTQSGFAAALASAWIAGGVLNTTYVVTVLLTTSLGRSLERSAKLYVTRC